MISDVFNDGTIASADFGAKLSGNAQLYFVPANDAARGALKQMMRDTVAAFHRLETDWEALDISEDYGDPRRVFAPRTSEYMVDIAPFFDVGALPELNNLPQRLPSLEAYFAVFRDNQGRKAVGVKKATQFKATLGAEGKLLRLGQDTLTLIDEKVVRLDKVFDAIVTDQHVFILAPRRMELLGNYAEKVAATAEQKIQLIHDTVPFLDLSRIKTKIKAHPRMARLAASVAQRPDLAQTEKDFIIEHAALQGITLKEIDGRLLCNVAHEMKLLEILDRRRYHVKLTPADPEPFRATGRQRVTPS